MHKRKSISNAIYDSILLITVFCLVVFSLALWNRWEDFTDNIINSYLWALLGWIVPTIITLWFNLHNKSNMSTVAHKKTNSKTESKKPPKDNFVPPLNIES